MLTGVAASGIVLLFLGAIALHLRRGEARVIGLHIIVIVFALVVVWGRFGPYSLS